MGYRAPGLTAALALVGVGIALSGGQAMAATLRWMLEQKGDGVRLLGSREVPCGYPSVSDRPAMNCVGEEHSPELPVDYAFRRLSPERSHGGSELLGRCQVAWSMPPERRRLEEVLTPLCHRV